MSTALVMAGVSLVGLIVIFSRYFRQAAAMTQEEIRVLQNTQGPFLHYLFGRAYDLAYTYWASAMQPRVFDFLAKRVAWFRILVLRTEQQLFKLAARIRNSSTLAPKPSAYWQGVATWKNGEGTGEKEPDGLSVPDTTPTTYAIETPRSSEPRAKVISAVARVTGTTLPAKRRMVIPGGRRRPALSVIPTALEHVEVGLGEVHF